LITGGSGFFGSILGKELVKKEFKCVNIDLERSDFEHENLQSVQGVFAIRICLKNFFSKRF
jgi:nucleoside-diphosphate-sugar epimerase